MTHKGKVLIIDDDPDLCTAIEVALRADGFVVYCADEGTLGLKTMREEKPDLVFLDVIMRMPVEGVWVSEEIYDDPELREIPVVMMTSIAGSEYAGEFPTDRPLHALMFLHKPVPISKILEVAHRYAGRPSTAAETAEPSRAV